MFLLCITLLQQSSQISIHLQKYQSNTRVVAYLFLLGVCGVPINIVALSACRALMRFDSHLPREKYLTDIYFVNIQEEITRCMINTFKQLLQISSLPASTYSQFNII